MGVGGQRLFPIGLPSSKVTGARCTEVWVGSGARVDECGEKKNLFHLPVFEPRRV